MRQSVNGSSSGPRRQAKTSWRTLKERRAMWCFEWICFLEVEAEKKKIAMLTRLMPGHSPQAFGSPDGKELELWKPDSPPFVACEWARRTPWWKDANPWQLSGAILCGTRYGADCFLWQGAVSGMSLERFGKFEAFTVSFDTEAQVN